MGSGAGLCTILHQSLFFWVPIHPPDVLGAHPLHFLPGDKAKARNVGPSPSRCDLDLAMPTEFTHSRNERALFAQHDGTMSCDIDLFIPSPLLQRSASSTLRYPLPSIFARFVPSSCLLTNASTAHTNPYNLGGLPDRPLCVAGEGWWHGWCGACFHPDQVEDGRGTFPRPHRREAVKPWEGARQQKIAWDACTTGS